jgi:hypothetical protein
MTVKELRKALAIFDGEQQVVLGCEHDSYTAHAIRDHRWEATADGGALVLLPHADFISLDEGSWSEGAD